MDRILVIGGTKFFGIPMVNDFLSKGYPVTVATRGLTRDNFDDKVGRITFDLYDNESVKMAFKDDKSYDIVVDKISYSSNEIRSLLDVILPRRFIHMSTANVYSLDHYEIKEDEFTGTDGVIHWNDRMEAPYDENKRNAERVLCQYYDSDNWVSVRYPVVLGENDYTGRLQFYVDHIINRIPMRIDNMESNVQFINEKEAGRFLSFISTSDFKGTINGTSQGTIKISEIVNYIEKKTGLKANISSLGELSPYNGLKDYSLSLEKAERLGFIFSPIESWIFDLLDLMIKKRKLS